MTMYCQYDNEIYMYSPCPSHTDATSIFFSPSQLLVIITQQPLFYRPVFGLNPLIYTISCIQIHVLEGFMSYRPCICRYFSRKSYKYREQSSIPICHCNMPVEHQQSIGNCFNNQQIFTRTPFYEGILPLREFKSHYNFCFSPLFRLLEL